MGFHSSSLRLVDLVPGVRLHIQPICRVASAIDEEANRDKSGDDHNEQNSFNPMRQREFLIV